MFSSARPADRGFAQNNRARKYSFPLRNSTSIVTIELVLDPKDIDQPAAQSTLVNAFIGEYKQYLSPQDIDAKLTSWHDGKNSVQEYYEDYFNKEFQHFSDNKIDYWVQAKIDGELAGWATFMREKSEKNAAYMDLLIVLPEHQKKGIGEHLVMSLIRLGINIDLSAIHLLLRCKNAGGREFYGKLGFHVDPTYHREGNYVDKALLEPLTWKNPALQLEEKIDLIPRVK